MLFHENLSSLAIDNNYVDAACNEELSVLAVYSDSLSGSVEDRNSVSLTDDADFADTSNSLSRFNGSVVDVVAQTDSIDSVETEVDSDAVCTALDLVRSVAVQADSRHSLVGKLSILYSRTVAMSVDIVPSARS